MRTQRLTGILLPLLLGLGFAVRAGYGFVRPPQTSGIADPDRYIFQAASMMNSWSLHESDGPTATRMPAYPVLLGLLFKTFGKHYAVVLLTNCVLALCALYLLFLVGRSLFGEGAALIALGLAAVHPQLVFYTAEPRRETLMLATSALTFWTLLEARRRADARGYALAGAAGALTALTNSVFLPFCLAGVPAALLCMMWKEKIGALRWSAVYLAAFAICYAPWPLRNRATLGRWVIGSETPKNSILYSYLIVPQELGGTPQETIMLAADPVYRASGSMGLAQRERHFKKAALARIRREPWRYARLVAWRFFWDTWRPLPRNRPGTHSQALIRWASILSDAWIIPLGFIGVLLVRLRPPENLWLYAYISSVAGVYSLFLTMTRYRLPLMPWMIMFAGAALSRLPWGSVSGGGSARASKAGARSARPHKNP